MSRFSRLLLVLAGTVLVLGTNGCYSSRGSSWNGNSRNSSPPSGTPNGASSSGPRLEASTNAGEYPTFRRPREPAPVEGSDQSARSVLRRDPNGRPGAEIPAPPDEDDDDADRDDGVMNGKAAVSKTPGQKFADLWRLPNSRRRTGGNANDSTGAGGRPSGMAQVRRVVRPSQPQVASGQTNAPVLDPKRATDARLVKLAPPPESYTFADEAPRRFPLPIDGRQVTASAQFAAHLPATPAPLARPISSTQMDARPGFSRSADEPVRQLPDWSAHLAAAEHRNLALDSAPVREPVHVADPPQFRTPPGGQDTDSRSSGSGRFIIPRIAICSQVRGFDDITEFDAGRLRQGQQIVIYATLENYRSIATSKGYRTLTLSTLEVRNSEGKVIKRQPLGTAVDLAESPRREFYLTHLVSVPDDLPPGDYLFELFVDDLLGNESARSQMAVHVMEGRSRRDETAGTSKSATRPAGFRR